MVKNNPLRIVFFGTPEFALPALDRLYGDDRFIIESIVTQPDKPRGRGKILTQTAVNEFATSHYLPVLKPITLNQEILIKNIRDFHPDFIVVVAYGQLLNKELLAVPKIGSINVHASLLPAYRGSAPIQRAIMNGETETGITFMLMSENLDQGDIITTHKIKINPSDNTQTVHDKLANLASDTIADLLFDYAAGKLTTKAQDHSKASYAKKIRSEDQLISWSLDATTIINKIRGLSPFPGAKTNLNNKSIKIYSATITNRKGTPGTILKINKNGIVVATGKGSITITTLQAEGGKVLEASEFVNGFDISVGDRFSETPVKTYS